jgi:hypothetical protein
MNDSKVWRTHPGDPTYEINNLAVLSRLSLDHRRCLRALGPSARSTAGRANSTRHHDRGDLRAWFGKPALTTDKGDGTKELLWQYTAVAAMVGLTEQQILRVQIAQDGKVISSSMSDTKR